MYDASEFGFFGGRIVGLSHRRIEFLSTLVRLVQESGRPVHYSDIAESMSVSKWTAYDMMQQLAAHNLVEIQYSVSSKGLPGRSQVLFMPTRKGIEAVSSLNASGMSSREDIGSGHQSGAVQEGMSPECQPEESQEQDALAFIRKRLELLRRELLSREKDLIAIFRETLNEKSCETPLQFCADVLLGIALELKAKHAAELLALRSIMDFSGESGAELLLVAGILLGCSIMRNIYKKARDFEGLPGKLLSYLTPMTPSAKTALFDVVKEVLSDVTPA